jgi:hypothetical protein
MYTPLAAELIRRQTERAAREEVPVAPARAPRQPAAVRRVLAQVLRRSADRLAPTC